MTNRSVILALLAVAIAPACDGASALREFPLPAASAPVGITVGSDGRLWFAEYFRDRIAALTVSGELQEFWVPLRRPYRVTTGADASEHEHLSDLERHRPSHGGPVQHHN